MDNKRIAKMADNVAYDSGSRIASLEDEALSNIDQAFDTILASVNIIDKNLPDLRPGSVPERASVDAIQDLMNTAIKPYLADALQAMQVLSK